MVFMATILHPMKPRLMEGNVSQMFIARDEVLFWACTVVYFCPCTVTNKM